MKKIFVISEYVNPNENTTGYYWHGIIVGLAARFDSIHLICPSRNIYRDVKNSGRINEAVLEMDNSIVYGDLKNVFIMPLKIKKIKQNSIISRVFRQINMTFSLLVILVRNIRRGDVVLCGTNPALLILTMPVVRICIAFK